MEAHALYAKRDLCKASLPQVLIFLHVVQLYNTIMIIVIAL